MTELELEIAEEGAKYLEPVYTKQAEDIRALVAEVRRLKSVLQRGYTEYKDVVKSDAWHSSFVGGDKDGNVVHKIDGKVVYETKVDPRDVLPTMMKVITGELTSARESAAPGAGGDAGSG
jgi:hypothetical protein